MLTFGVDERRTEPSVEDPGDGDGRVLVGVMFNTEPDVETEGPAACSIFRPVGDLIDCCASRRGRPALPLKLVPYFNWYLLARCGFRLLVLGDIARRLFYCLCNRWYKPWTLCVVLSSTYKDVFYFLLGFSDCGSSLFLSYCCEKIVQGLMHTCVHDGP